MVHELELELTESAAFVNSKRDVQLLHGVHFLFYPFFFFNSSRVVQVFGSQRSFSEYLDFWKVWIWSIPTTYSSIALCLNYISISISMSISISILMISLGFSFNLQYVIFWYLAHLGTQEIHDHQWEDRQNGEEYSKVKLRWSGHEERDGMCRLRIFEIPPQEKWSASRQWFRDCDQK